MELSLEDVEAAALQLGFRRLSKSFVPAAFLANPRSGYYMS